MIRSFLNVNKDGYTIVETIAAVFMLAAFSTAIFSSVLFIRGMVLRSSQLDAHFARAEEIADTVITALWRTETSDNTVGNFSLTQSDYDRIDSLTGADNVNSFSYDPSRTLQYMITPKTITVYKNVMVSPNHSQKVEETIVIGFNVDVRAYYGGGTNEFAEVNGFANLRGGEWDVS